MVYAAFLSTKIHSEQLCFMLYAILCPLPNGENFTLAKNSEHFTLYSIDTHLNASTTFENIVGKEKIARNEQFLLFPQCFLPSQIILFPFVNIFDIISLFAAELEEPKVGK